MVEAVTLAYAATLVSKQPASEQHVEANAGANRARYSLFAGHDACINPEAA
jgi:preprotein translocase subunit SecD